MRLGVNIDHIATLRNARGGVHPDTIRAALECRKAGANSLTIHLREDRRHIRDEDLARLSEAKILPINLELAATEEMLEIALRYRPEFVCIVPEKRQELTTEGGLDVVSTQSYLKDYVTKLENNGIKVSMFINADEAQARASCEIGASAVEIHTGSYADASDKEAELQRIAATAKLVKSLGLAVHAGHGLNYDNVIAIATIPEIEELNIGHFLVGEAVFIGLEVAVRKMIEIITLNYHSQA